MKRDRYARTLELQCGNPTIPQEHSPAIGGMPGRASTISGPSAAIQHRSTVIPEKSRGS